jgi:hypothetical protein
MLRFATITRRIRTQGLYHNEMQLLEALASAFINTFGITQPTDAKRRRAAWFILGMLSLLLIGVGIGGVLIFHMLRT